MAKSFLGPVEVVAFPRQGVEIYNRSLYNLDQSYHVTYLPYDNSKFFTRKTFQNYVPSIVGSQIYEFI